MAEISFGQGLPPFIRNSLDTNADATAINNVKAAVGTMNLLTNAGLITIHGSTLNINSGVVTFQGVDVSPVNIGVAFQFANNGATAGGPNVVFNGAFNGNGAGLTNLNWIYTNTGTFSGASNIFNNPIYANGGIIVGGGSLTTASNLLVTGWSTFNGIETNLSDLYLQGNNGGAAASWMIGITSTGRVVTNAVPSGSGGGPFNGPFTNTITKGNSSDTNEFVVTSGTAYSTNSTLSSSVVMSGGNLTASGSITATNLTAISTNNDNAGAGYLGEFTNKLVAVGSPVSLTTATAANICQFDLTRGDWDVSGNINFSASSATVTGTSGGISTTSATVPSDGSEVYSGVQVTLLSETDSVTLPRKRISIAVTTTVYLVGKSTFSAGSVGAFGSMTARRVR